jgi:predicted transcriptional regulator
LESHDSLDQLFFELASESRLNILLELQIKGLRMQEIARKLDLTDTETCRQLQRLSESSIIAKHPDNSYRITNYGKLVLGLIPSLRVAFKHKLYFMNHDLWKLPYPFIRRLGELENAGMETGLAASVNRLEEIIKASEQYVLCITNQTAAVHSYAMAERLKAGVKFRSVVHPKVIPTPQSQMLFGKNVDRKILNDIPAIVVVTDKEALVSLFTLDGNVDFVAFVGGDPLFLGWSRDLFEYCWKIGEQVYQR